MNIPGHQSNNFYAILQAVFGFCLDFQMGLFFFHSLKLDFFSNDSESFKEVGQRCCLLLVCVWFSFIYSINIISFGYN